jgi:hypothetical protein
MDRELRAFSSFAEADSASRAQYGAMSPDERLALVLELCRRHREEQGETAERLARVYRVVELARR